MFNFLPKVWLIPNCHFSPRKLKYFFSTVCRRLVRGIKEGWSVIDIARDSLTSALVGRMPIPVLIQVGRFGGFLFQLIPEYVLLCCLGWDDEENCGNFIFTRKSLSWSYRFRDVTKMIAFQLRVKICRIPRKERTLIQAQNLLGLNKPQIAASPMMTGIVKLRRMVGKIVIIP